MSEGNTDNRVYIGNLPTDIRNRDIEDLFYKYGKIKYIDLKNKRGPPFAFVEFEDPLDAEDSIKGRDGYNFDGYKLRVEIQKASRNSRPFAPRGGPPTRRSEYRCIISGLPPTGSWQDIKDHMRVAGNVCYADVFKDGTGVCEFIRYDDMKYAVKHLHDTKFRSHEGETSYVKVKAESSSRKRSVSRSYSRSRSRSNSSRKNVRGRDDKESRASPSYSPVRRSRSKSRSRSIDKRRKRSYSRSNSRSRSPRRSRPDKSASRSRSRSYSLKRRAETRSNSRSRSNSNSIQNQNGTENIINNNNNNYEENQNGNEVAE